MFSTKASPKRFSLKYKLHTHFREFKSIANLLFFENVSLRSKNNCGVHSNCHYLSIAHVHHHNTQQDNIFICNRRIMIVFGIILMSISMKRLHQPCPISQLLSLRAMRNPLPSQDETPLSYYCLWGKKGPFCPSPSLSLI